jgi:ATP/maltotriose-dependent transcriptional regulator MalT
MLRSFLVITLLIGIPSAAIPCINATLLRGDGAVKQVKKAEDLLEQGKNLKASQLLDPHAYRFRDEHLQKRAFLLYQVAEMRARPSADACKYAAEDFAEQLKDKADDPYLSARFAEALALWADFEPQEGKKKTRRARALSILSGLSKRDLMPDAAAYATLARVHHRMGDKGGERQALIRCRKMTRYAKAICRLR